MIPTISTVSTFVMKSSRTRLHPLSCTINFFAIVVIAIIVVSAIIHNVMMTSRRMSINNRPFPPKMHRQILARILPQRLRLLLPLDSPPLPRLPLPLPPLLPLNPLRPPPHPLSPLVLRNRNLPNPPLPPRNRPPRPRSPRPRRQPSHNRQIR